MLPARYDFDHYQGDELTLDLRVRLDDGSYENLQNVMGTAQVRATPASDVVLASFTVTIPDQSIMANRGVINCYLPPGESAKLLPGNMAYDVQTAHPDGGAVRTRVYGTITVIPQVTR